MRRHGFVALCDLTAELSPPRGPWRYTGRPWLDLTAPDPAELEEAARAIEALRESGGPVLVCCALGRGRSACAVAGWLLLTGRATGVGDAIAQVRASRPCVALRPSHALALRRLQKTLASS
jgi:protein-tyrosine phosphatase